jgi:hypothetical protein
MDPLTAAAGGKLVEVILERALTRSLSLGWRRLRWLPTTAFRPNEKLRVSCSAFVRICDRQQRILLIQNLHRPEFFGPVGGCFKFYEGTARSILERCHFSVDQTVAERESARDVRGYLKRRHVVEFLDWFAGSRDGRESGRECVVREIHEELFGECGVAIPQDFNAQELDVAFVRSFLERSRVSGTSTVQLRYFEVHSLLLNNPTALALLSTIESSRSRRLLWATADEIARGRHLETRRAIGHAAVLLVNDRLTRPDMPSHATSRRARAR